MRREANFLLTAAIASVLLPAGQTLAQQTSSVLEEIIVTAERRATTEQTTAISMNVLTADDLATNRTQNIADLQQTTPNITINNAGGFNNINIRGVGNSNIQPSITVGVAVFQDGLLNAETITLSNQFLDLGTAEILRGPQGTFIGASSTGGAIRLNSVRPSLDGETSGYIEGLVGSASNTKLTGAVNLPISDTFAARIAFNQERRDSYFYSRGTLIGPDPTNPLQRPGSVNDLGGRISLLWRPSDKLEMIWRSEYNRTDSEGTAGQPNPRTFTLLSPDAGPLRFTQAHSRYWNYDGPDAFGVGANGTLVPTGGGAGNTVAADPTHDPEVLSSNQLDSQFLTIIDRHSLEWTYTFDGGTSFRSLTGFVHNENQYIEDQDSSMATAVVIRNNVGPDNNYYSQEFNLISPAGPFNWILGTSWFYRMTAPNAITETYDCGIDQATGIFRACPIGTFNLGIPTFAVVNQEATQRTGGIFGQINWTFVEDLELTVGARYNIDRNFSHGRDTVGGVVPVIANAGQIPNGPPVGNCPPDIRGIPRYVQINWAASTCLAAGGASTFEDETPTWKVGLNWSPGDNNFFYLFYARGYKSGGAQVAGEFEPETVDDYELGWKGTFADGRAQLNIGGFFMDYQDIQQQAFLATTQSAGNAVINMSSADIKGLEMEFVTQLGGLGIQATLGYVDSELGTITAIDRTLAANSSVRVAGTATDLRQCGPGETPSLNPGPGACVDWSRYMITRSGDPNVFSPELQYSLTLSYDFLVGEGTWTPRISYNHTDEQDINVLRREDFWRIPEQDLTNVSLTYTQGDWLVQAYCANCADKKYIAAIGAGGGITNDSVVYGAPLNYGVRVRRSF